MKNATARKNRIKPNEWNIKCDLFTRRYERRSLTQREWIAKSTIYKIDPVLRENKTESCRKRHPNRKPVKIFICQNEKNRLPRRIDRTIRQFITCEHKEASSWKNPRTKSQYSLVVIRQVPWIPIQHGWPITSHTICSAVILSFWKRWWS